MEQAIHIWANELKQNESRTDIIALNFGMQKAFNGFEMYLSGHTWFDNHDLWILDEKWAPANNFISLGRESLQFDRLELLGLYKKTVSEEIKNLKPIFDKFEAIFVGLVDSDPIRIK
ncbi:MAG: hypothetical protein ACXWDO_10775 [Bacteroidia bacterium]